jgi:hypothetical protein
MDAQALVKPLLAGYFGEALEVFGIAFAENWRRTI